MPPKKRRGVRRKKKEDTEENQDSYEAEDSPPSSPNLVKSSIEKEEKDAKSSIRRSSRRKQNALSDDLQQIESSPSSSSPTLRRRSRRSVKLFNDSSEISPEKPESEETMEIDEKNESTVNIECNMDDPEILGEKDILEKTEYMEVDKAHISDNIETNVIEESVGVSEMKTKKIKKCRVELVSIGDSIKETEVEKPSLPKVSKMDVQTSKLEVQLIKESLDLKDEEDFLTIDSASGNEVKNSGINNLIETEIINSNSEIMCETLTVNENITENSSTETVCKNSFETVNENILLTTSGNESKNKASSNIKSFEESNNSIADIPAVFSEVSAEDEDKIESSSCSSSPAKNSTLPSSEESIKQEKALETSRNSTAKSLERKSLCSGISTVENVDLLSMTPVKDVRKTDTADIISEEELVRISLNLESDAIEKMEISESVNVSKSISTSEVNSESDLLDEDDKEKNENGEVMSKITIVEEKQSKNPTVELKSLESQIEENEKLTIICTTEVDKNAKPAAISKIEVNNEKCAATSTPSDQIAKHATTCKADADQIEKPAATSKTEEDQIAKPSTTTKIKADQIGEPVATSKMEVDKNSKSAATYETEVDNNAKFAATSKAEVDNNTKSTALSKTGVDNEKSNITSKAEIDAEKSAAAYETEVGKITKSVISKTEVDKITKPATSKTAVDNKKPSVSKTEVDNNEKLTATSKTEADKKKSVSPKPQANKNEKSTLGFKAEVSVTDIPATDSKAKANKSETLSVVSKTGKSEKSDPPSKTETNKKETSAPSSKTETNIKETSAPLSKTETNKKETSAPPSKTETNKKETSASLSKTEKNKKETSTPPSKTETNKKETSAPPSKTEANNKETSASSSKTETNKKETSAPPSKTETGSDSQKNKIPGRGFIIGTRGVAEDGKKTLFDCVLCFNGEDKYGVPGFVLNKHIKTKDHALKVMEVENQTLYKQFKDNTSAKAEDVINTILDYEETQKRQTLVLASDENYLSQRQFLVKKIALLKEYDSKPDDKKVISEMDATTKTLSKTSNLATASPALTSKESDVKKPPSKPNTGVVSSASFTKVPSKKRKLSTEQVETVPSKVPIALNTLSFLSSLKKKNENEVEIIEIDSKKPAGKYSIETLSQQLAEKQKSRHPDKIVLVMDDRDVFLCAEKLGDFVRVIRKRDLDFARAVDLVKSDFWFGKGTLFIFLGGVFSSIKVRKHSTCAQYKCEIPVRVYHIEKDTPANIIIDEALQLHKVILDSTNNDQAFFCDLLPVNVDSHNVLKVDKRLCYSTHPIDFHKKVPVRFLDQYAGAVNEFNKFAEKHSQSLGFKFESLVVGSFGRTYTDIKFAFGNMSTDGVSLKEANYKQRCSSIISMVEAVKKQLHSVVSKNDPKMVKSNEKTTEKSNSQFDKVAIIANSYYKETLIHFASDKVVVFADEDLKFEGIEQFILEKKKNLPEKTLWLTLIGSFCISEIKYHDACQTKLSCKEPLITLVPSPEVQNLSSLPETIRKIKESTLALLKKVRGLIGSKSVFFIIPPYPPTIVSELSFTHSDLHSLKCPDIQIYVASEEVITQLNLAFTRLSKEIISLVIKEFQTHKLKCSSVEIYSKSLPAVGHLQVVRRKSDPRSSLFNKWQDCVKDMICEFVDCSVKEIPVPVRTTKKFDHLIFIGHQNLLNQLSDRSGAKFSIFNLNYPINFEFLQMKLSSLKSISNKPMLFVIACDFSLIAKEVFDAKCNNLKCTNMMSYFASESKDIKTVISDKLLNMRNMILKIKDTYPVNATVIIAPLFSRHCVERPSEINETVHRTLHVILKHVCSPCVLEGPRKYWEDGISLLQYYLKEEVLSNLYIRNDNESLTNVIESFLSLDTPYIQWIKPVVAPITDKFKYNIKILFDKLCETVYANNGLNDSFKSKSTVTVTIKKGLAKAVTSVESKKSEKNSIPVVNSKGKSIITAKPVPTIQDRTLVRPNNKTSNVTASTSNQTSHAKSLQNTSIQNTSTQNTSTQNTSTNYQVPTVPYSYNTMNEHYNSFGMNQGYYPSNSYSYYFPSQQQPQQQLPSVEMLQQPPPLIQQPPPLLQQPPQVYPYQFPPPQQEVGQQQYYSVGTDLSYSYSNNFNNSSAQASYTPSQPSISDMLSSSSSQVAAITLPSAQVVQPLSSIEVSRTSKKFVPKSTAATTVIRSVVKNIVIEKPKELVDFLSEFGSNTWRDRPYEHAFVIGKKELIDPLSSQNLKNVKFVYQNLASLDEGQVSFLIKKMGAIPHRSVCFLAFGLSIIMKTTPITPGCRKFKCKQPVSGSCLKTQSHLSQQMNIITRIKDIVNLASKMAGYIPVIVLPIFPSKVFVDDAYALPYHKISHAITDKKSYVLVGERKEWEDCIGIFLQTWNNFMKVHHDKYTYPKALPKYPYLKDTIRIKDKVNEFFEEDNQPVIWENAVKKMIKILMSYTEGSNIEKTITITKTEETTVNNNLSSSTDTTTQTVVKVWNVSESIPEKFFDFLFKAIDPKADLEKIVENNDYYFLVKLTKVSAILITRKLDNILIGDSTLRVCLIHNQDDYPELTFAQEKYITSMFQDAYSRFKSQIMRNIKNKLLNVIDFTNYKTHKCNGTCRGDKTNCNLYHNSSDRRRNPLRCTYMQKMCTSPGVCTQGDLCSSAHNIYEQMFYPTNFQTILCPLHDKNTPINNGFCKFAHKNSPELFFTGSWQDIVTFGTQNSLRFLSGAIRAIHKLTLRTDVKICFITQSEDFLEVVFKMIDDFAFQYNLKCVNLEKIRYNTNAYDVYFGKPSTINNYSGKILSINDYGVLIVDNIKAIMEDSQDAEHLLKICQRLKISAGLRSPINKVFVSSAYDQGVTGVVSRFLGIPLQEVKDSDIHPEPKLTIKTLEEESKSNSDESSKDVMVISSRSRSRSHSPSRTSRSRRSVSKSYSRRSSSRSRRKRSRSRSLKRRSRSRSRSRSRRRSKSRSRSLRFRKRRSRSWSITRSRKRSSSRSRRSRSKSKTRKMLSKSRKSPLKSHTKQLETHSSKSHKKHSPSPKSSKAKKRQASPKNPSQISKISKLDELLAKQSQISQKSKMDYLSTKLSENVFSPHGSFQSSSKISLEVEKNVPSVKTLGEEMYKKFLSKKASIHNSVEEEFKAYKAFPELHPNYEMHYEEFLADYYKTYGMNTKEDHKEGLWIMFWAQKVKKLKEAELDNKNKELEKEFLNKAQPKNIEKVKGSAPQKVLSTSPDAFSIENSLKLLEELSSELGMLGPAIVAIINSARESGATTSKGLSVITDEENLVLIKMVIEKMNTLQKTCPTSQLPKLIKGVEWTQKLIECAKNPPKEQGLNLMAIAKASLGKDSGFTLNLIKTALAYEGLPSMSKEEINQLFLKVCSIHFEMAMQDK